MGSGKNIKFALCEVLQFAGLGVPIFVVMQRFASIMWRIRHAATPSGDANTTYWLIVASSVAYVTTIALLAWVPMKYMIFKKRKFLTGRKKWRPVALAYVILSTLPCFGVLIASSEVQISNRLQYDTFTELPVSLVLFSLIFMDITERIRHCRLTGQANQLDRDADIPSSVLTNMQPVGPVGPVVPAAATASQVAADQAQNGASAGPAPGTGTVPVPRPEANGAVPGLPGHQAGQSGGHLPGQPAGQLAGQLSISATSRLPTYTLPRPLRFLCASDARADVFVDGFMFWFDTVEMVRMASHPGVYYSGWVFPIYIFSYLSVLRVIVMPGSPLLPTLGVALQDLPFLFVRMALIAMFGFVTPLLYLFKNLLVSLAFIYFNFMTKLRVFNTQRMF
ncbi:transmembrane protein 236 [Arapaima gigas]